MSILILIHITGIVNLFSGAAALENLAFNKTAVMSTQRDDNSGAEGAVDGNTAQTIDSDSCALTKLDYANEAWWQVDLNGTYAITELKIYLLNSEKYRFRMYSIHVTDNVDNWRSSFCTRDLNDADGPDDTVITLNCDAKGRYVTILSDRNIYCESGNVNFCAILQLCEVQVLGCYPGNYNRFCNLTCPVNCRDDLCIIDNGDCYECEDGYIGNKCDIKCKAGSYGRGCERQCNGFCVNGDNCSHVNAVCPNGCMDGYLSNYCNISCSYGYFGANCVQTCGNCVNNETCSHIDGSCNNGCASGWKGFYCNTSCTAGKFGDNCLQNCSANCKDNLNCDRFTGKCNGGCKPGWKGDTCDTICSPGTFGQDCSDICGNCLNNETCIHTDGSCSNGCASGWKGTQCKTICSAGQYGINCSKSCSINCLDNSDCDRFTGHCNGGCKPGWDGDLCNAKCESGKLGANCSQTCGNCYNGISCDHVSGTCVEGCDKGWEGDLCLTSCQLHKHGYNCLLDCSHQCRDDEACNRFSGSCDSGCNRGWKGTYCNETCGDGTHGYDCMLQCSGNCKNSETCDRESGTCSNGCQAGWQGIYCNITCAGGYYGEDCSQTCGECYDGAACERTNGTCSNGCSTGYKGHDCKTNCLPGEFGRDCRYRCSEHCINQEPCDISSGICTKGCDRGWKEEFCNASCEAGRFGFGCNETCGNCLNNETCNGHNGSCISGCEPGWTGDSCTTVCEDGAYGSECKGDCSGHCDVEPCNKMTGKCDTGCSPGWEGIHCNTTCSFGTFGANCLQNCSDNCKGNETCDRFDGSCLQGCKSGWEPPLCEQGCRYGMFGEDCLESCGNCFNQTTCDIESGVCEDGCIEGFYGDYCTGNATNSPRDQPSDGQSAVAAVVSVVLILAVIVGVLAALYLLRRRKLQNTKQASHSNQNTQEESTKRKTKFSSFHMKKHSIKKQGSAYANVIFGEHLTIDDEQLVDIEVSNEESTYYNIQASSLRIPLTDLKSAIVKKSYENNKLFRDEFLSLSASSSANCKAAQLPENIPKNRYKTTFPYDHSRVVLQTKSPNGGDYINANFINGINSTKRYIACQGPKETTLQDHWCMIWHEGVDKIVMLTNIIEKGKKKCDVYWPAVTSDTLTAGDFTITLESEQVYASCTIRKLILTNTELNESRPVSHFHYTTWPDHGVPDALDIVLFHRQVRTTESQGPLLVHCSAGIGRTGTFIALDALIDDCKSTGYINAFEYVQIMRENRMGMIQTLVQYVFVHVAILEHLRTVTYTMPKDTFADDLLVKQDSQNEDTFNEEFQNIQSMVPEYTENDYQTGLLEKNHSKNISQDILPVEAFAAFLQTSLKGQLDYINAVYLSSYTRHNEFIVTQIPTNDHITDFLRLLLDHGISTVVALLPDTKVVEKVQWMPEGQYHSTLGSIKLQRDSERSFTEGIDERIMTVKRKSLVNKFRILSAHCIHEDDLELTELDAIVQLAVQVKADAGTQKLRTLVMSKDGAVGCGLFLTVYNAIEQLQIDDEVDICTLVRRLKIRRPQLCTNLMEYKLCYRLVADYLIQTSIYANT